MKNYFLIVALLVTPATVNAQEFQCDPITGVCTPIQRWTPLRTYFAANQPLRTYVARPVANVVSTSAQVVMQPVQWVRMEPTYRVTCRSNYSFSTTSYGSNGSTRTTFRQRPVRNKFFYYR